MRSHRNGRAARKNSKTIEREKVTFAWLTAFVAMFGIIIFFSLGSRISYSENSIPFQLNKLRNKVRGWEKNASISNSKNAIDTRNHSGFHFSWPSKFSPPVWTVESNRKQNRESEIQEILKLSKTPLSLKERSDGSNLFLLSEFLTKDSEISIQKDTLPLLPGEKVFLRYPTTSAANRSWKVRVRCVGATQDRRDAPLKVKFGFSSNPSSSFDVDPNGPTTELNIPTIAEFSQKNEKNFELVWPSDASGLLVIEGFQLVPSDSNAATSKHRTLVIHIDSLDGSLTTLNQTQSILKSVRTEDSPLARVHFTNVVPASDDFVINQKSFFTWRNPVELGSTVVNESLRNSLNYEPILIKKLSEIGGSVRRINLTQADPNCRVSCETSSDKNLLPEANYSTEMTIRRREELASTAKILTRNEFFSTPGSLLIDIRFPSESLRLNWTTAFEAKNSTVRWIFAGLNEFLGKIDINLKNQEKTAQVDVWIAEALKTFFASDSSANVAIFLHNKNSPLFVNPKLHDEKKLVRGEAFFLLGNSKATDSNENRVQSISTHFSDLSLMRIFEKINQAKEKNVVFENLLKSISSETSLVTQINQDSLISMTPQGWLIDQLPIPYESNSQSVTHAPPESIYEIQEKSNSDRKLWRLHGLHVLLPNNNSKEEVISLAFSTDLHLVGCESESENAQLESQTELAITSTQELKSHRIVGRRELQSQWHVHCLLEGRITERSRLKIVTHLNDQPISREKIGLGEFALPIRGFLWRSPETLELTGAQILDATVAVKAADKDSAKPLTVVIWTDSIVSGLSSARTVLTPGTHSAQKSSTPSPNASPLPQDRLSGK